MTDLNFSKTEIALQNDSPDSKPSMGGGLPILSYWAKKTLDLKGALLWKTLLHKSACLSCAWGTSEQKGGFQNEDKENLH